MQWGTNGGGDGTVQRVFGSNPAQNTSVFHDVIFPGGLYPFLQVAQTVRVQAGGNAADDIAGSGARIITIVGLDENWQPATETLATAGASASAFTTTKFIRINRSFVSGAGVYGGGATGNMIVESENATDLATIEAGLSFTRLGLYSVAAGFVAHIEQLVIRVSAGARDAEARLHIRTGADVIIPPMPALLTVDVFEQFAGNASEDYRAFDGVPERSDISIRAKAKIAGGVTVGFGARLIQA